jgi:hypothetical protein
MATIGKVLRNWKQLNLLNEAMKAITDVKEDVVEINKSHMQQGENKNGGRIGEYRSAIYGDMKARMNPRAGGYVDLILTGAFTNAMYLKMQNKGFAIDSNDRKKRKLVSKYGNDVFGLGDKGRKELVDKSYRTALMTRVRKVVKL